MAQTNSPISLILSPFDLAMGPIYVRKLFGFRFEDPSRRTEACDALRQGLSATATQHPFAAAGIILVKGNAPFVIPSLKPSTIELGPPVFVVKDIAGKGFPCTYQELCEQGVPPSLLQKELLSSLPNHPTHGELCPAMGLQVNFLHGGWFLSFAFHHTVFDGASMTTFLRALGANIMAGRVPADCLVGGRALERLPYSRSASTPPKLSEFPEYDFSQAPMPRASSASTTARVLTFTADKLAALTSEVAGLLQGTADPSDFVSTADCLGGLLWVAVMRARQERLFPHAMTKWAIAVNARRRLDPPLPAEYFGNAVVCAVASVQVNQLVATDEPNISVVRVACAGSRIRQAVVAVDDAYIRKRMALFKNVSDPAEIPIAAKRALRMPSTGLDFSDWREQGADVEFAIPGAGSKSPDWVRKTWSANEGTVNILPRKGGRKGSADWEVLLALSVEDMEKVCTELTLGGWTLRISLPYVRANRSNPILPDRTHDKEPQHLRRNAVGAIR
ncbi:hypothetical protein LTR32_003272 [Rachicladosporium monterosium]|uniref:Uncharacterized protein n=1 Tax=Rachicladosporium monterosium TaxID=1507873 RepID=A0ABR0L800_9PEZI|nr:hypothetical protein LTR32_003272 [Rachicladosporium monterosium]